LIGILSAFGAATSWTYACFIWRSQTQKYKSTDINLIKNIIAFLIFIPAFINLSSTTELKNIFMLLISGIIGIGLGDTFYLKSLQTIGTRKTLSIETLSPLMAALSGEFFINENLTTNDYEEICKRLKRKPNRTELGMFGVMWSEHCCYRNSKPLLSKFPTEGKNVLVGPGENAGVIDVGNNQKLVFKIESHNHPSAIEPFQGAATGVGGILRDIFTMGARPIAVLNSLRFGNLDKSSNVDLLRGVVSGIAHYGNCVGVPTVGGEIDFDDSYSGNPLVNVMALGLLETDEIVCSGAKNVGSPVLYVGNTTGRDGVGGASFASSELTTTSLDDRPAVQVGDPFVEKSLIEACLEAFKTGDVIAAQDMGAAGLTCSSAEMAANGNLGISIDLDLVPSREDDMSSYQYLLSESQERMLFVVKEEKINDLIEKFNKWGLYASVIGEVIGTKEVIISHKGKIVANVPTSALSDDTPVNFHNVINNPPDDL